MNSLLVGVGISDRAAPGDDPVADAVMAEALGYGAVAAARRPAGTYPTYETQTLLTWIAARTTRVSLVPRVLGVPFRRPALIAKAAESLQRLSGGRFILGLGAGYHDAEIRAVGGPDPAAGAAAGRPAGAVRAIYSVPVRLDPRARTTAGVLAGSAADIIEPQHGFTQLGFTGFDLMPSRDQMRAVAEDILPALRELQLPALRPQPSRSPA